MRIAGGGDFPFIPRSPSMASDSKMRRLRGVNKFLADISNTPSSDDLPELPRRSCASKAQDQIEIQMKKKKCRGRHVASPAAGIKPLKKRRKIYCEDDPTIQKMLIERPDVFEDGLKCLHAKHPGEY